MTPEHQEIFRDLCTKVDDRSVLDAAIEHIAQLKADNKRLREFCEFAWRDVPMNEYAFEKLEALLAATKPKPEESSLARG
jgi:predicted MarR family transcription regulator